MVTAPANKIKPKRKVLVPGLRADARALKCNHSLLFRALTLQRTDMPGLLVRYATLYADRGLPMPDVPAFRKRKSARR